jgi:hypothetical protein
MRNIDYTKMDFAKHKTDFTKEYERIQFLAQKQAWKAISVRGWLSRILHALAGKSIMGNWN